MVKGETVERRKHRRLGVLLPHTEKRMWRGGSPDSDQASSVPAKPQPREEGACERRGCRSPCCRVPWHPRWSRTPARKPTCHAVPCCAVPLHQHTKTRDTWLLSPHWHVPWLGFFFPFPSSLFFSFICFSNNVTHPEQDVCIHHSPCLSALFPSGRCLPARRDYLSESSRCRAVGITHGVRFEKGGGRPDSALCLQLFISRSLIYFFSLLSFFFCQCSPSWLSELPPPCSYTGARASGQIPAGCKTTFAACPTGAKRSPVPSHPARRTRPSHWDPPLPTLPTAAGSARSAVAHFCSLLAQLSPIPATTSSRGTRPPWHKPLCPSRTRADPDIPPPLPPKKTQTWCVKPQPSLAIIV
ncbi:uncharacterized protein [Ciconia boyciana]|uniref:uncharacterized protein n=1 Tax=Ciconia boyciana TaxID=52775 RepID=UPI003BA1F481